MNNFNSTLCTFWSLLILSGCASAAYYGKSLGKLSELHHAVSGHVYAVDGRTLFIKDFTYDGEGPAAYFYVGNSKTPSNTGGIRLRDERGSTGVLKRYRGRDITLSLPEGKTFHQIKWFSVWCDEFSVNFGDVKIPRNLEYPKPQKISGLAGVHGVSSDNIVIVDAQTLLIPNFSYDGEAPDAKFWVGRGNKPSPQGIRLMDENGKETPLRKYDHKTIVLTLPQDLTIFDIGHFGVWCEAFTVDFGHISIPQITNVPPSLKMLGVSPQSKLNCEVLYDDLAFEVRWAVAGESVVIQLVAKLEDGEYMSFGISGDDNHSQMVGSDVTVAWVDKSTLKGYAFDYYLDAKSQCAGNRGSCPDDKLQDKSNSVRLLNAAMVNGYSIVTYQRPLKAADELDRPVLPEKSQPIVWAVGPLNSRREVSYHTQFTKEDRLLDFGRPPAWNCPMPETEQDSTPSTTKRVGGRPQQAQQTTPSRGGQYLLETTPNRGVNRFSEDYDSDISETSGYKEQATRKSGRPVPTPKPASRMNAWEIPSINCDESEDGALYVQMGPTGGKQGYPAITGHVGWGISWYVNGLLIPEINVVRGKTYTFITEGGFDPNVPARYHPFYITDDAVGGYEHKTPEERAAVNIYAGVRRGRDGDLIPEGVGRLCVWEPNLDGPPADDYSSFGAYQRTLTLKCDHGEPGFISWTPDKNTPDTVYYQCFTHRYLGWKINVLDSCDITTQGSEKHEVFEEPDFAYDDISAGEDLLTKPSLRIATRIKPDTNFLVEQQRESQKAQGTKQNIKNIENHNLNGSSDARIMIREIGRKPDYEDDVLTGEVMQNRFGSDSKDVSPESNPRPDYDIPITKNQFKQVIDSVEEYEASVKNQKNNVDNHPVYQHTTVASQNKPNEQGNIGKNKPYKNVDELQLDAKNSPPNMNLPHNPKPMTLQTFMRPVGKPPMMGNNMFYRRPMPQDMRNRRPVMNKPILGMPPRLPPPFMLGQPPPFMMANKKQFFKMPPMNRPPMNSYGRPMINPMKQMGNNMPPKHVYPAEQGPSKAPNQQPIILGKPSLMSQTLTLGQPTVIGQHIVKSQMTLPSSPGDNVPQQSNNNLYFNKPGQIIMGKPMDNPMPLDQQMIPTRQHVTFTNYQSSTQKSYTPSPSSKIDIVRPVNEVESTSKKYNPPVNMTPSELINSSVSEITMKPAVNTGFKPDSVVIEGGFKPIIREPLLSEGDRITDYDADSVTNNRRNDEESSAQEKEDSVNNQLNNEFYEKQLTESFEPMFIPSPPDRHMLQIKNITIPKSDEKLIQYEDLRPRPVYIKPADNEGDFDKDGKKRVDDMAMAADRVDAYYLPPDHRTTPVVKSTADPELPAGTVVSYDGHQVSDSTLTSSAQKNAAGKIYSAKLSSNAELLLKSPQFGPFRGEIPSLIQGQLNTAPPTKLKSVSNSHSYPGDLATVYKENSGPAKSTHLSLVSSLREDDDDKAPLDDLDYEGSENNEERVEGDDADDESEKVKDDDDYDRVKRSADHTPDHTPNSSDEHSEHDHSGHDHSENNHSGHDHSTHDHSGHDHSAHDHSAHDHFGHDHSGHDHSGHDHSESEKSSTSSSISYKCSSLLLLSSLIFTCVKFL